MLMYIQILFPLSDSQWDEAKAILQPKERKRKSSLQVVASGIIYLLEYGCKWGGLPLQYGNCKTVLFKQLLVLRLHFCR